ncbi:MAG TPA: carboxy terminal-processing peptidase [Oleiagrimonas sp.]|nr:carboxy terminal-processing peptidase [Oleiagrimonas sp.]
MKLHFVPAVLLALVAFAAQAGTTPAPAATASPASAASTTTEVAPVKLKPTAVEAEAAQLSARFLTRFHYHAQPLDDAMSRKIFKAYLKALDGNHMFFTQADIKRFAPLKTKLDDAIWNRDLAGPFAMFNLYLKRAIGRFQYAQDLLDKDFTFTGDQSFELDRSEAPWPKDMQALDELWNKRVKNDWLRLKLAGKKPDEIRKLLKDRYQGYLHRMQQLDGQDVFQTFMDTVARTTDPHTDYFGPRRAENFAIAMKLSLEGIGAVLQEDNDYTMIRRLVTGGPAKESGELSVGDRIVGVAQGKDGKMLSVVGWRLDDVVQKIRGKKGTVVRLEVIPAKAGLDGKHKVVTLTRDKVTIKQQAAKKKIIKVKDDGKTHLIGVIDLPSFYEDFAARSSGNPDYKSATRDVAKLLKQLKKAGVEGIIVDLRNNGGGSLSEAVSLTGLFINKGPVVQVRKSDGSVEVNADTNAGMVWAGPLAVLVNRGTASASEIFAAAIKDYGRGIIIGEPTFGKGTVQNLVNLDRFGSHPGTKPTYGELKMTIAKFFRITGGSTQLRGVTPDIEFPKNGDAKDFGEETYDNALPWTHIPSTSFKPVGNLSSLIPILEKKHKQRAAKSPAWQLMLDELAVYRKNRARTKVSLNYAEREAQREHFAAVQKAFNARHDVIDGDTSDSTEVELDDGLNPGERSLKKQLEEVKEAKNANDVELDEAAHIVADVVELIHAKPKLATEVLPYDGKFTPGFGLPARTVASDTDVKAKSKTAATH